MGIHNISFYFHLHMYEFLADRGMTKRGFNTVEYQYLILKQASYKPAFSLVNTLPDHKPRGELEC